jgi:hypothetical protein
VIHGEGDERAARFGRPGLGQVEQGDGVAAAGEGDGERMGRAAFDPGVEDVESRP